MARILILGYGNPLRCDDGLGWRAAENLADLSPDEVEVRVYHQLLPEVVDLVSQADMTFFIDAARDGEPGEVRCAAVAPESAPLRFSHQLSPAMILGWSRELYGRFPKAFAVSVCGSSFQFGERLSAEVAASLPRLTGLVRQLASQTRC